MGDKYVDLSVDKQLNLIMERLQTSYLKNEPIAINKKLLEKEVLVLCVYVYVRVYVCVCWCVYTLNIITMQMLNYSL